ncbi:MAG: four helix bundle protein [Flavobacteriales bacterium]|nr:MAG: four helix bundle protein [Flavobacteriales bacterium]
MAKIEHFEDLECWQKSRELVKYVYLISREGGLSKDYDLRSQLRKAALSVMNNIAEGFSRYSAKEFIRFLDISLGSNGEVKSMIYVLTDLNYINEKQIKKLHEITDNTRNLTLGLIRYLKKRENKT